MKLPIFVAFLGPTLLTAARLGARQDNCNNNNCYRAVWGNDPNLVPGQAVVDCQHHLTTTEVIYPLVTSTFASVTFTTIVTPCPTAPISIPEPTTTSTSSVLMIGAQRNKGRQIAPPSPSFITSTVSGTIPAYATGGGSCDARNYRSACLCKPFIISALINSISTTTTVFVTATFTNTVVTGTPCPSPTPSSYIASSTSNSISSSLSTSQSGTSSSSSSTLSSSSSSTETASSSSSSVSSLSSSSSSGSSSSASSTDSSSSISSPGTTSSISNPATTLSSTTSSSSLSSSTDSSSFSSSSATASSASSTSSSSSPSSSSSSSTSALSSSTETPSSSSSCTGTPSSSSILSSVTSSSTSISSTFSTLVYSTTTTAGYSWPTPICTGTGVALCGKAGCQDLRTSNGHCGACNNLCATGKYCVNGVCVSEPCDSDCDLDRLCNNNGTESCICATETGGSGVCYDKERFSCTVGANTTTCSSTSGCSLGFVCVKDYCTCDGTTTGVCVSTEGCGRQGADIAGPLTQREGTGRSVKLF
ncbi:hypothetical protein EK21DRAFT_83639 [Setomelanomma holmii]|uniref:Antifreeze protein n=1 Tax=Setomelanomma holmii TaxID=210430 RepID=A0A9P4HMI2_9PLEO|nr:hypothetical protein EK21DRAFT_83639 [Setomelanomma holmii]